MPPRVVDADNRYLRYISLCTHTDSHDPAQMEASETRMQWLKDHRREGRISIKVAIKKGSRLILGVS